VSSNELSYSGQCLTHLFHCRRELWPMIDSVVLSLFTDDCSRGVSDTLYHSRHYSRDKHFENKGS